MESINWHLLLRSTRAVQWPSVVTVAKNDRPGIAKGKAVQFGYEHLLAGLGFSPVPRKATPLAQHS